MSPWLTLQVLGFLPCAFWAGGSWLTGDKKTSGWVVLFVSEFFWGLLGWYTGSWTLVGWSVVGLGLYARNYRLWRGHLADSGAHGPDGGPRHRRRG